MGHLSSTSAAALLLLTATTANAHFTLTTPPAIGFNEDAQNNGPCGGIAPDLSKNTVTDFHVGGQPVGMRIGHPQATWLFRATLDQTASSNWTQLFPLVLQNGLGFFCETQIPAPAEWVGKKGILSVVAKAEDGLLYQCAAVNFVSGVGSTQGLDCRNSTSEAAFTQDPELSALVSSTGSSSPSTPTNGTIAGSSPSSPTPSKSGNAAPGTSPGCFISLGNLVTVLAMGVLGASLML